MHNNCLRLFTFLFISLVSISLAHGSYNYYEILGDLTSSQISQRNEARYLLTVYIEDLGNGEKKTIIDRLLKEITASNEPLLTYGIAKALGDVNFFWDVDDLNHAQQVLYLKYKQCNSDTLKLALDRALMNSKNLYFNGIAEYSKRKTGKDLTSKFERTFNDFPLSSYAERAHFYYALNPIREYCIKKRDGEEVKLLQCAQYAIDELSLLINDI